MNTIEYDITMSYGPVKVKGVVSVDGMLAVHKEDGRSGLFSLDHLETGLSVAGFMRRKDAIACGQTMMENPLIERYIREVKGLVDRPAYYSDVIQAIRELLAKHHAYGY